MGLVALVLCLQNHPRLVTNHQQPRLTDPRAKLISPPFHLIPLLFCSMLSFVLFSFCFQGFGGGRGHNMFWVVFFYLEWIFCIPETFSMNSLGNFPKNRIYWVSRKPRINKGNLDSTQQKNYHFADRYLPCLCPIFCCRLTHSSCLLPCPWHM